MTAHESQGFAEGKAQTRPFPPQRDYSSLSIKDLLDAREAYHVHLSNIASVVGTAIGRYRIHERDWYANNPPNEPRETPKIKEHRTLENSVVRPWSWPCVLVFVKEVTDIKTKKPYDLVPRTLYLPDGRVVPTCVVFAEPDESPPDPPEQVNYASHLIGGGYACSRTAQGETRVGTIACMVEREGTYYALTNRHVAGPDGGAVDALIHGERVRIGTSDTRAVSRAAMTDIFPDWPGKQTLINLDAGLIELDDVTTWTSQVFGIGEIGDPYDATMASLTLDLIGCPVRAYGAASGVIEGEIQALFVRYKTLNGFDYVSDVLIGRRKPREDTHGDATRTTVDTQPGDSGTLWFYDPPNNPPLDLPHDPDFPSEPPPERGLRARRLRPIAMQWGGQRVKSPDGKASHALATFLSTVCRVLDVDIVRGYSTGHDEYWGKTGHFSIGWKACDRISGTFPKLAALMKANQRRIGFDDKKLVEGTGFRNGRNGFVPLADVPDYVFGFGGQFGAIQHFADIDIRGVDGRPSMLDRCADDLRNVSAQEWFEYFDGFTQNDVGPDEGTLPFRVWQLWQLMVDSVKAGDIIRYVTAAGVMAHYVGDASQPLHASYLHHGRGPTKKKIGGLEFPFRHEDDGYQEFHDSAEAQIHAIYEQQMLEIETDVALAGVNAILKKSKLPKPDIKNGWEAACSVIELMLLCRDQLTPDDIIDADDPSLKPKERARRLWQNKKVREGTLHFLAESSQTLGRLWMSAWKVGGGEQKKFKVQTFGEAALMKVFKAPGFAKGLNLEQLAKSGKFEPP